MDQLNIFRRVAHAWIVPSAVQIPAAACADNLSIDPAISAGHTVYHQAGRQQYSGERRADQSNHGRFVWQPRGTHREPAMWHTVRTQHSEQSRSQLNDGALCFNELTQDWSVQPWQINEVVVRRSLMLTECFHVHNDKQLQSYQCLCSSYSHIWVRVPYGGAEENVILCVVDHTPKTVDLKHFNQMMALDKKGTWIHQSLP